MFPAGVGLERGRFADVCGTFVGIASRSEHMKKRMGLLLA